MQANSVKWSKLQDPAKSAKAVGLHYVSDDAPGIRRQNSGAGWVYRDPAGKVLHDRKVVERLKQLAIPPAWTDVWICPDPNGHLQATGRDARRRKQHRYHPRWREIRDETKYNRMLAFAKALPGIRRQVQRHLKLSGLPREKVLATVVRLLEVSLIRVGNAFGLTTMKDRHVNVNGSTLRFSFRGKAGIRHQVDIADRRLAKIVKSCQDLPGQELFQYLDDEGKTQDVRSSDVNEYLRQISGQDFTAKDFRTWAGTVLAAIALREFEKFDSKAQARKNILQAIESVAEKLGNTVAICRKCYIHPDVIGAYLDGTLMETLKQRAQQQLTRSVGKLRPAEAAVVGLLQQRLTSEKHSLETALKESLRLTGRSQKQTAALGRERGRTAFHRSGGRRR
jgi:DNA topoisomerase I